jgi:hypothetical protein
MKRGMRVGVLLAVLLALWMLWRPDTRGSIDGAAPATVSEPSAVRPGGDPQLERESDRLRAPAAAKTRIAYGDPTASGASIAGLVVDPAGAAVPGATVSCSHAGPVRTDEAGRFLLAPLPAGEHGLWAEADSFAPLPAPPVRTPEGARVEGVSLVLTPALGLAGRLFADGDAGGVGGATVSAVVRRVAEFDAPLPPAGPWSQPRVTTSDSRGAFRLAGLPRGQVELTVTHPDFATFGRLYTTGTEDVSVLLTRAGSVTGRVVGPDGQAATIERVSVLVSVDQPSGPWRFLGQPLDVPPEDAARGFFRVRPRTLNWLKVAVEGPELHRVVSEAFQLDDGFAHDPLVLRASDGARLRVHVRDELGDPVSAAQVVVVTDAGFSAGLRLASKPALTNAGGDCESAPLARGEYRVEVRREGHFPADVEPVLVEGNREIPPLQVELRRAGAIRGRVFARSGGALPELRVRVLAQGRGGEAGAREEPELQRVHPSDGTFRFPCLEPALYRAQLIDEDGDPLREADFKVAAGQECQWVLDLDDVGRGSLHGTLTWNGAPLPSAVVSLGRTPLSRVWHCTTDRTGRYHFAGVGPGTFFLAAHVGVAESFIGHGRVEMVAGEDSRRDLYLTTGTLSGRVLLEQRAPLAGPRISIEQDFDGFGIHRIASLGVDSEGRFECAALPAGALLLSTSFDYQANVHRRPIDIRGRQETTLDDLVLTPTGSLAIHVMRPSAVFLDSDVEVEVRRLDDGTLVRTSRFARGERLVIDELSAGPIEVLVRCLSDRSEARGQVVAVAGEPRTVIVEF